MATSGFSATTEHRFVEFDRPAFDVGIEEQLRRGDVRPYNFAEPGPWAEARCACGQTYDGMPELVIAQMQEHVGLKPV